MIPLQRPQRQLSVLNRWVRLGVAAAVVELGIVLAVVGWNKTPTAGPIPDTNNRRAVLQSSPVSDALLEPLQVVSGPPGTQRRSWGSGNTSAAKDRTEVEICGFGTVELRPDDPNPVQGIPPAQRESALAAVEALMLASDDIQVRAAALWIGIRRGQRDARTRIEQVARMAVGSQDPVVYALAIEACKGWTSADNGTCHLISRSQWAHLDPDNAVPWLEIAAQARQNNDTGAAEAATRMAAHARHTDTREGLLPTLVDRALATGATPLQRTLALNESWSAQAVWAASHAPYLNVGQAQLAGPPAIGLDLSCNSVDRMQDWMRQKSGHGGSRLLLNG